MNPCPCGNLLSTSKSCRCSDIEIKRYKNRLSDPFLDRIDLNVCMQENRADDKSSVSSKELQQEVFKAFAFAKQREQLVQNGNLSDKDIERHCKLSDDNEMLLLQASQRFALSARAINKVKKVARTIADLKESEFIEKSCLLEALSFRWRSD